MNESSAKALPVPRQTRQLNPRKTGLLPQEPAVPSSLKPMGNAQFTAWDSREGTFYSRV